MSRIFIVGAENASSRLLQNDLIHFGVFPVFLGNLRDLIIMRGFCPSVVVVHMDAPRDMVRRALAEIDALPARPHLALAAPGFSKNLDILDFIVATDLAFDSLVDSSDAIEKLANLATGVGAGTARAGASGTILSSLLDAGRFVDNIDFEFRPRISVLSSRIVGYSVVPVFRGARAISSRQIMEAVGGEHCELEFTHRCLSASFHFWAALCAIGRRTVLSCPLNITALDSADLPFIFGECARRANAPLRVVTLMLGAANCASTNEVWDGIERLGDIRASVGMRYDLAETLELAALSSCGLNEVAIDICRLREAYTGKSTALQAPLSAFAKFCRQNRIRTVVHDIASDADLLLAEACGAHAMQGDYWGLPQPPQIFGIQCGGSVPECIEPAKSVSTMRADRPRRAATQVALSSVGDQR